MIMNNYNDSTNNTRSDQKKGLLSPHSARQVPKDIKKGDNIHEMIDNYSLKTIVSTTQME